MIDRPKKPILTRVNAVFCGLVASLLVACAVPERAPSAAVFDFGVTPLISPVIAQTIPADKTSNPALALSVQSVSALEGTGMRYRLAYDEPEQLRTYTLARWAMPPAELFQQRLQNALAAHYFVVPGSGPSAKVLRVEVLEISQLFQTPGLSTGRIHLRATFMDANQAQAQKQRAFLVHKRALTPDAGGGVIALRDGADALIIEILDWLKAL